MSDAHEVLKKTVTAVGEVAERAAASAIDKAGDATQPLLEDAHERLKTAVKNPESMDALLDSAEVIARDLGDAAAVYARQEPIKAILWAAGAGALAMALIQLATADRREATGRRR